MAPGEEPGRLDRRAHPRALRAGADRGADHHHGERAGRAVEPAGAERGHRGGARRGSTGAASRWWRRRCGRWPSTPSGRRAQVRAVLGDIQKSTSNAVLATEEGNKAVASALVTRDRQPAHASSSSPRSSPTPPTPPRRSTPRRISRGAGWSRSPRQCAPIGQATSQSVMGTQQSEQAAHDLHRAGRQAARRGQRLSVLSVVSGSIAARGPRRPRPGSPASPGR